MRFISSIRWYPFVDARSNIKLSNLWNNNKLFAGWGTSTPSCKARSRQGRRKKTMIRRLNQIYIKPPINMSVFIFAKNVVVGLISTIAASQEEQTEKWMSLVSIFSPPPPPTWRTLSPGLIWKRIFPVWFPGKDENDMRKESRPPPFFLEADEGNISYGCLLQCDLLWCCGFWPDADLGVPDWDQGFCFWVDFNTAGDLPSSTQWLLRYCGRAFLNTCGILLRLKNENKWSLGPRRSLFLYWKSGRRRRKVSRKSEEITGGRSFPPTNRQMPVCVIKAGG